MIALSAVGALIVATPAGASISQHGPASSTVFPSNSTTRLSVTAPPAAAPGDLLIAALGVGRTGAKQAASLNPPAGWTLISRKDRGSETSLAVYRHVYGSGESTYTFEANSAIGGTAFVTALDGADTSAPIDDVAANATSKTTSVDAPSVRASSAGSMILAAYAGSAKNGAITSWTAPSGMSEIGDANSGARSGSLDQVVASAAGATGTKTARSSVVQDSAIGTLIAVHPAASAPPPPIPAGPTPLIIDTDIFSDVDDVGTLATAYGLQIRGEAKVIAVGLNTRTSRPAVSVDSWRCVAAVNQFYGASDVPIGTHLPNNGTDVNTADFAGPCGRLAPASLPAPDSAVNVYRRALAQQPDGSVVMALTGYFGNLADLLKSPPDSISPLSGRDLVALKVRRLVAMGGGYPSRSGENNLVGDPAAAQYVSENWPTKLVWAGYEVGDAVHTGQTISAVHPTNSPVRVAYEAFVRPGNWIYSYDLVALYHAIRPTGSPLSEVGPGTNTIGPSGSNSFATGSGNQYYLRLSDPAALSDSIEALLDTLPPTQPTPAGGLNDTFDGTLLDPARWVPTPSGSTIAVAGGELQISHPAGAWTKGSVASAAPVDVTGRSLSLEVLRAANGGLGGSPSYGETSIFLQTDATHYVEFFVAGGSLTAWVNRGSGETNLTPGWPAYSATGMRWLRFRESNGTLYLEYASGTTAPGQWTALAATPSPFGSATPTLRLTAGSNTSTADVARFDNVATSGSAMTPLRAKQRRSAHRWRATGRTRGDARSTKR